MGREIRRVPKDWQHPTYEDVGEICRYYGGSQDKPYPVYDRDYSERCVTYLAELMAWERGEDDYQERNPEYKPGGEKYVPYWDWAGNPPSMSSYRHGKWVFKPEDATHYQVYETVSEGTPKSPVFATLTDLADWLVTQGYSRENADAFAKMGRVPSMVFSSQTGFVNGIDAASGLKPKEGAE